jgi:NTE family protein
MQQIILKIFPLLFLLCLSSGCCPHHYVPKECPDPLPSFYMPKRIRVAVVLGSGGIRGMAHVGVLEELEKAGIPIDLIVGCSAGSIVGALYADNPCAEDIIDAVGRIRSDSLLDLDLWNCRYGLSQGKTMHRVFNKCLSSENFCDLQIPLIVVATDLYSGELVPIGAGNLVRAVRASCSIPFLFVPCEYGGRVLIDGGIVNPVPVKVARDLGAEIVIAVDLCELLPKTFPTNLFEIATRSAEIAFMWRNDVCTRDADIIIRPKTCGVGTFNDKMKWSLYEAGCNSTLEKIEEIKALYSSLPEWDDCYVGYRHVQPRCYTARICLEVDE